jgi:hypothetical protein
MAASETDARPRAPRSTREDPEAEARAAAASPVVLHSLDAFGEVPLGVLDIVRPKRIVEIGGEGATFTRSLVAWADAADAAVLCVDPLPSDALRRLGSETRLELVEGYSPEALEGIEPCDLYVVDGDHCYAVVRRELEVIARKAPDACVLLHDVAWPCARRDFYYGAERLPEADVRPHSFSRGITVESPEMVDRGGLAGAGAMAIAEEAGGEANGVLTAVEDAMAARDDLVLALVPCIYGLGVLYPQAASWAAPLREFLAPYDGSVLLGNLEANRLQLLTRVLATQGELERRGAAYDRAVAAMEARIAELTAENLRLRSESAS